MALGERPLVRKTLKYSSSGAGMNPELSVKLTTTAGEGIETSLASEIPEGIVQEEVLAGDKDIELITAGECNVIGSETMSLGDWIVPAASGKFKNLRGLDSDIALKFVFGRLKEAISTNGYSGVAEIMKFFVQDEIRECIQTNQTINASGEIAYFSPRHKMTLQHVYIAVKTTIAAHDTNYQTFTLVNKGQAGIGTTAMLKVDDLNTTKSTGGVGLTGYKVQELVLHGTAGNLAVAKNDVLVFESTKAASAPDLVNPILILDFQLDLS